MRDCFRAKNKTNALFVHKRRRKRLRFPSTCSTSLPIRKNYFKNSPFFSCSILFRPIDILAHCKLPLYSVQTKRKVNAERLPINFYSVQQFVSFIGFLLFDHDAIISENLPIRFMFLKNDCRQFQIKSKEISKLTVLLACSVWLFCSSRNDKKKNETFFLFF